MVRGDTVKEKDECLKKDDMIQVLFMKLIHGYTANGFQKFKDLGVHPGQLPILSRPVRGSWQICFTSSRLL